MKIGKSIQDSILAAISEIGTDGATITQIEKKVNFERHTLSKYLSFMQGHGLLFYRDIGTAKVWFINSAPLQAIAKSVPEHRTFIENVLTSLISSIPCGVVVVDADYNIEFANKPVTDFYGQLMDLKFYSAVLGVENPLKLRPISRTLDSGEAGSIEIPDKSGRTLQVKSSKFQNPDSSSSLVLIIEDVTEQRIMENRMKLLSSAVEQTGDIVLITDRNGIIQYVNHAFEQQTGYSRQEALGAKPSIIKSNKHKDNFYQCIWKTILSGRVYRGILINRKKNGKLY
jgi:PAS domain S-box-containing protein